MTTYRIKIGCGNCCSENKYDVERGTAIVDAELVCPNCGCSPVERDFEILTSLKLEGKARQIKEQTEEN